MATYKAVATTQVYGNDKESKKKMVVIVSPDEPTEDTFQVNAADVEGLEPDDIIMVGSVIVTPGGSCVAFNENEFTVRG